MTTAAGGATGFVSFGEATSEAVTAIAWWSADGRIWTQSATQFADFDVDGVIWDGSQYVAFGENSLRPAVWLSTDGQSWSPAADIPSEADIDFFRVAEMGGQLYGVGVWLGDDSPAPYGVLRTWTSDDGSSWEPVSTAATDRQLNYYQGLTASKGMLVAWGDISVADNSDGVYQRPVVLNSTNGGQTWTSALVGKVDSQVLDVTGVPSGLLAVGSGPYCCEEGGNWPVRAWTSSDASTWIRAAFLPDTGVDMLTQVAPFGGGYVALGTNYGEAMSWRSDDGTVWIESSSVPDTSADPGPDCTGGPCPATVVNDLAAGDLGLIAVGLNRREIGGDDDFHIEYRSVVWMALASGD